MVASDYRARRVVEVQLYGSDTECRLRCMRKLADACETWKAVSVAEQECIDCNDVDVCRVNDTFVHVSADAPRWIAEELFRLLFDGSWPAQENLLMRECAHAETGSGPLLRHASWGWADNFNPDPPSVIFDEEVGAFAAVKNAVPCILELPGEEYLGQLLHKGVAIGRAEFLFGVCIAVACREIATTFH
ncbi:MAG: hypothetical protein BGO82_05540 [Devosia sp. 67-54]|nr:MAG: hypothetical protein BGO82_05540 [Devosia sp. 67-54]